MPAGKRLRQLRAKHYSKRPVSQGLPPGWHTSKCDALPGSDVIDGEKTYYYNYVTGERVVERPVALRGTEKWRRKQEESKRQEDEEKRKMWRAKWEAKQKEDEERRKIIIEAKKRIEKREKQQQGLRVDTKNLQSSGFLPAIAQATEIRKTPSSSAFKVTHWRGQKDSTSESSIGDSTLDMDINDDAVYKAAEDEYRRQRKLEFEEAERRRMQHVGVRFEQELKRRESNWEQLDIQQRKHRESARQKWHLGRARVQSVGMMSQKMRARHRQTLVQNTIVSIFADKDSMQSLQSIFNEIDTDGSGSLDREEFTIWIRRLDSTHVLTDGDIHSLFEFFDSDGDGSITYAEFKERGMEKALSTADKITAKEIQAAVRMLDNRPMTPGLEHQPSAPVLFQLPGRGKAEEPPAPLDITPRRGSQSEEQLGSPGQGRASPGQGTSGPPKPKQSDYGVSPEEAKRRRKEQADYLEYEKRVRAAENHIMITRVKAEKMEQWMGAMKDAHAQSMCDWQQEIDQLLDSNRDNRVPIDQLVENMWKHQQRKRSRMRFEFDLHWASVNEGDDFVEQETERRRSILKRVEDSRHRKREFGKNKAEARHRGLKANDNAVRHWGAALKNEDGLVRRPGSRLRAAAAVVTMGHQTGFQPVSSGSSSGKTGGSRGGTPTPTLTTLIPTLGSSTGASSSSSRGVTPSSPTKGKISAHRSPRTPTPKTPQTPLQGHIHSLGATSPRVKDDKIVDGDRTPSPPPKIGTSVPSLPQVTKPKPKAPSEKEKEKEKQTERKPKMPTKLPAAAPPTQSPLSQLQRQKSSRKTVSRKAKASELHAAKKKKAEDELAAKRKEEEDDLAKLRKPVFDDGQRVLVKIPKTFLSTAHQAEQITAAMRQAELVEVPGWVTRKQLDGKYRVLLELDFLTTTRSIESSTSTHEVMASLVMQAKKNIVAEHLRADPDADDALHGAFAKDLRRYNDRVTAESKAAQKRAAAEVREATDEDAVQQALEKMRKPHKDNEMNKVARVTAHKAKNVREATAFASEAFQRNAVIAAAKDSKSRMSFKTAGQERSSLRWKDVKSIVVNS